jgi:hypothetical protein
MKDAKAILKVQDRGIGIPAEGYRALHAVDGVAALEILDHGWNSTTRQI